jgi:hypothetical protein
MTFQLPPCPAHIDEEAREQLRELIGQSDRAAVGSNEVPLQFMTTAGAH